MPEETSRVSAVRPRGAVPVGSGCADIGARRHWETSGPQRPMRWWRASGANSGSSPPVRARRSVAWQVRPRPRR